MPEASFSRAPRPFSASTASTFSRSRNVTLLRRSRYWNASPISPSSHGRTRSRWSTTVTFEPSAPNIDAYSTPITPAPTTVIERGTRLSSLSSPSESMIVRSSNSTDGGRGGPRADGDDDPLAPAPARPRRRSRTVWSSTKRALPGSSPTRLRRNCSRVIAVSADTTAAARSISCWIASPLGVLDPRRVEHVERARGELLQHGLAQRLGRDRAGMDRDAAEAVAALGDGDALAQLGGLDRGPLAARARSR